MKSAERDLWTTYAKSIGGLRNDPVLREHPGVMAEIETPRSAKYGNVTVQVDGHTFDSKKEAGRFQELKYMQQAKQIADLELQPVFPLHVMELFRSQAPIVISTVGIFTADFRYVDLSSGEIVVEDVKSKATKNTAYKLRKKIAEAVHGIQIREL